MKAHASIEPSYAMVADAAAAGAMAAAQPVHRVQQEAESETHHASEH